MLVNLQCAMSVGPGALSLRHRSVSLPGQAAGGRLGSPVVLAQLLSRATEQFNMGTPCQGGEGFQNRLRYALSTQGYRRTAAFLACACLATERRRPDRRKQATRLFSCHSGLLQCLKSFSVPLHLSRLLLCHFVFSCATLSLLSAISVSAHCRL